MNLTRILIVEDEALVATDLSMRLTSMGYQVVGIADNGADAMALVATHVPELVLMDIHIKGNQDGIQTAQAIRRQHDIPVVFLTAYSDDATVKRATDTDPFGYVLKPFDERHLQITIEIAHHKYATQMALVKREQWIRSVLDTLSEWVLVTDLNDTITYLNDGCKAGLHIEVGKNSRQVLQFMDRDGNLLALTPIDLVLQSQQPQLMDWVAIKPQGGAAVVVQLNATPLLNHVHQLIGVVTTLHNITQRKETERTLWSIQTNLSDRIAESVKRYQKKVARYQQQLALNHETIKELKKVQRRYLKLTQESPPPHD